MTIPTPTNIRGFYAYPSEPIEIGDTVERAVGTLLPSKHYLEVQTWRETDVPGRFIADAILEKITQADFLLADISSLNFNVTYEVGFAIGSGKRVIVTLNASVVEDRSQRDALGIFDTLGFAKYQNSAELTAIIQSVSDLRPLEYDPITVNVKAPVYLLDSRYKTDKATHIVSMVKKARLFYRSFDPNEQSRLSAHDAIKNVAQSAGVLVPLLSLGTKDAPLHNLRAAFIAGLAQGMGKALTILQDGDDPVPVDCRDLVFVYYRPEQIDEAIEEFAKSVVEALQAGRSVEIKKPGSFLSTMTLGASSAENELRDLGAYYLQTGAYQRAERGESRLVVGRKGSGKTALFAQLRDELRRIKSNIVLDLKPEGYKLLKFKDEIVPLLSRGTLEHTVTAFWEYLLLLEICYKLLEKDKTVHIRNHKLFEPYRHLADTYETDMYVSEGDFSERMGKLLKEIASDCKAKWGSSEHIKLSDAEITGLLYKHNVGLLRQRVHDYLKLKGELWLLLDNLDRGWPTHGIRADDLIIIRTLLEGTRKLEREFRKDGIEGHTVVFLRNDVYELLLEETPDRGKESRVVLDWTDAELLRELVRRRIVFNGLDSSTTFEDIWPRICVSHVQGEESAQFLIDRCLMRPRCLIDLVDHCRAHAVNLGKSRIDDRDIDSGLAAYSSDLLLDISFEIRDVAPYAEDILYAFIGVKKTFSFTDYQIVLAQHGVHEEELDSITTILLWHAFLGIVRNDANMDFIYSVNYDMKRLKAILRKRGEEYVTLGINPAFWPVLGVH